MDLKFDIRKLEPWTVMSVRGELDVYSAAQLREPLYTLVDVGGSATLLDLEDVEFMDSMGLRVIVGAHKRATAVGSTFAILCTRAPLLSIFRVTGLSGVLTIYDRLPGTATG